MDTCIHGDIQLSEQLENTVQHRDTSFDMEIVEVLDEGIASSSAFDTDNLRASDTFRFG